MAGFRRTFALIAALVFLLLGSQTAAASRSEGSGVTASGNQVNVKVTGSAAGSIATSPLALTPAFGRGIVDYVWRCRAGTNTLQVTLTAIRGGTLRIGERRGTTLTLTENMLENQALVISAPWSHALAVAAGADRSDEEREDEVRGRTEYWIRCLPHDFPALKVTKGGNPPPGWYLTGNVTSNPQTGTYAMVLDNNGTPVWYHPAGGAGALNVTSMSNSSIAWDTFSNPNGAFIVYDLRRETSTWLAAAAQPTDFHELQQLPNGNLVMLSSPLRSGFDLSAIGGPASGTIDDCVIQEMRPNGALIWTWRASDHITAAQSLHPNPRTSAGLTNFDIYHCNSVDVDPVSGNVLLSARHLDAISLIDRRSGTIVWKMGGNGINEGGAYSLRLLNDPIGPHGQHDARFVPGGQVSLYDNETWNPQSTARAVVYKIDAGARTATLTWSYSALDGQRSMATGSFRRLDNGSDNVICWGFKLDSRLLSEVDGVGRLLLTVQLPMGIAAYRVIKIPQKELSRKLLRATAGTTTPLPSGPLPGSPAV